MLKQVLALRRMIQITTYLIYRRSKYATFKAAVLRESGKPLVIEDIDVQKLTKDDVRLHVSYCSLASLECEEIKKWPKTPFIPGCELVGDVLEVGQEVTRNIAIVGERVMALSPTNQSGFAEQCVVKAQDVFRLPPAVDPRDAAVLVYGHSIAILAFSQMCRTAPKQADVILVSCNSSGLGLAAIDVASSVYKARVVALCDTEEHADFIRTHGVLATHLLRHGNLNTAVSRHTNSVGVQFVYDTIGMAALDTMVSCLAPLGNILTVDPVKETDRVLLPPSNSNFCSVDLYDLRDQDVNMYRQVINDTLQLADQHILTAHISSKFSLDHINDAIKYLAGNTATGKVLIEISR